MTDDLILYQFSRWMVEKCLFSHFLSLYAFDKLPEGQRLQEMMGSMTLCVGGYEDDEREIHTILEVRRFYRAFHAAWPYWLYFCNLKMDSLKRMVMCCLPSSKAIKAASKPRVSVTCDPLDLLDFLKLDLAAMNCVCERAGMFEEPIERQTHAVFEHFGLPYSPTYRA